MTHSVAIQWKRKIAHMIGWASERAEPIFRIHHPYIYSCFFLRCILKRSTSNTSKLMAVGNFSISVLTNYPPKKWKRCNCTIVQHKIAIGQIHANRLCVCWTLLMDGRLTRSIVRVKQELKREIQQNWIFVRLRLPLVNRIFDILIEFGMFDAVIRRNLRSNIDAFSQWRITWAVRVCSSASCKHWRL